MSPSTVAGRVGTNTLETEPDHGPDGVERGLESAVRHLKAQELKPWNYALSQDTPPFIRKLGPRTIMFDKPLAYIVDITPPSP